MPRFGSAEVTVARSREEAVLLVADLLEETIRTNPSLNLGTATGGTMEPIYAELARRVKQGKINLRNVNAFQLDEYFPITPTHPQSYSFFLREHLVKVAGLPLENLHVPNGAASNPAQACRDWEEILKKNPIDLQLLGVGLNGHVAFIEPRREPTRELPEIRTSLVELEEVTIRANSRFFKPGEAQPHTAITVGLGTLLERVNEFVLVAFGKEKSEVIARALLGEVNDLCPASYLREARGRVSFILDKEAARQITV